MCESHLMMINGAVFLLSAIVAYVASCISSDIKKLDRNIERLIALAKLKESRYNKKED